MAGKKHHETAVLVVTDTHYGKATGSYNPSASTRQHELVVERVTRVADTLRRSYDFDRLVLALLGDGPDGSDIYPSQAHHQDITNAEEQAIAYADDVLTPFVKGIKESFRQVDIRTVPGNHGRSGKHKSEAENWDITAARYLEKNLDKVRGVNLDVPRHVPKVHIEEIRGHRFLLYHGDGVKGYQGIPFYGLRQRALNWRSTATYGDFRVLHVGHFHSFGRMQHNDITIMLNGTMVSDDQWALDELGYESQQAWHFHGVSDERPITFDFGIETGPEPVALALAG